MPKLNKKIEVKMGNSYKLGMNEVVGLKQAMAETLKPVVDSIVDKVYWTSAEHIVKDAEYKSRDGFIANSDNRGGIMIDLVIPSCERYDFGYLEFGECDGCNKDCTVCRGSIDDPKNEEYSGGECGSEVEGHLDARLRIWFKFEGINDDGELEFYINGCGGNGDAPYFRIKNLPDFFEASFACKSVAGIKRAAAKHIKKLLKIVEGK